MTCPNGHVVWIPATFHNVRVTGAQMNLAVTCKVCSVVFDAAPGKDVLIDTVDGRLQVRQVVRTVRDLRSAAKSATSEDLAALKAVASEDGAEIERLTGPFADWAKAHPATAAYVLDKFGDLIVALIVFWVGYLMAGGGSQPAKAPAPIIIQHLNVTLDHDPTDQELEQIVRNIVRQEESERHKDQ